MLIAISKLEDPAMKELCGTALSFVSSKTKGVVSAIIALSGVRSTTSETAEMTDEALDAKERAVSRKPIRISAALAVDLLALNRGVFSTHAITLPTGAPVWVKSEGGE